jgi:hypothetical protein
MWALIAQGIQAIGGVIIEGKAKNKQAAAENARVREANLLNAIETADSVSTLMGQQVVLRDKASTAHAAAIRQASLSKDSAEAQAAAAGVRGASADAVIQDIDRELGWATASIDSASEVEQFNMQTRLRSLISSSKANVIKGQPVGGTSSLITAAIGQGLLQMGATYASNYFQFGASSATRGTGGGGNAVSDYTGADYSTWVAAQRG